MWWPRIYLPFPEVESKHHEINVTFKQGLLSPETAAWQSLGVEVLNTSLGLGLRIHTRPSQVPRSPQPKMAQDETSIKASHFMDMFYT